MSRHTLDELPPWPEGAVAVLSTGGGDPHAIPVSTALRAGPRTLVFALSRRRESLERLRREPRVALSLLGADLACTALGPAEVVEESLAEAERVAAVRLDATEIQDHLQPRYEMQEGVRWRWIDGDAAAQDAQVRAGLRRLAESWSRPK